MKLCKMAAAVLVTCLLLPVTVRAADEVIGPIVISYADAVKAAQAKDPALIDIKNSLKDLRDPIKDAKDAYDKVINGPKPELELLGRDVLVLESQRDKLLIQQESLEISVELSIRNSLAKIAGYELDIQLLESTIRQNEINVKQLSLQSEYGMISGMMLKDAELTLEQNNNNLLLLNISLQNERQSLNRVINQPMTEDVRIEYDLTKIPQDKDEARLYRDIRKKDPVIREKQIDADLLKYDLFLRRNEPRADLEDLRKETRRALRERDDAQKKVESVIYTNQKKLEQLLQQEKALQVELDIANDNYQKMLVNYNAGLVTKYKLDNLTLAIQSVEADLVRNEYDYWIARFMFDYPFLSA